MPNDLAHVYRKKLCSACGREFTPNGGRQVFCVRAACERRRASARKHGLHTPPGRPSKFVPAVVPNGLRRPPAASVLPRSLLADLSGRKQRLMAREVASRQAIDEAVHLTDILRGKLQRFILRLAETEAKLEVYASKTDSVLEDVRILKNVVGRNVHDLIQETDPDLEYD